MTTTNNDGANLRSSRPSLHSPNPVLRHVNGVNCVLELIGTVTLLDSIQAATPKGIVCNTGILGNEWIIKNFEPPLAIPSTVKLTVYKSEIITAANSTKALEQIVDGVAKGRYHVNLDKVFQN